jgi:hypothetical protein
MRATRPSLLARAGSAAAVAVLAGGGVMATATAASAAGHPKPKVDATTLSIKNKPIAHNHHHASSITGVLRDEHTGVANETITLYSKLFGKNRKWVADPTTETTGTDGSVSFTVTVTAKTQYKLVFAGDKTNNLRGSHSNVITVKVVK